MEKNLLKAAEALKKSAEFTDIERIMETIEESISIGCTEAHFWHIPFSDIEKLKELGYTVDIVESNTHHYVVSWKP